MRCGCHCPQAAALAALQEIRRVGMVYIMLFGSLVSLGAWTMADGIVISLGSGLYGLLRGS